MMACLVLPSFQEGSGSPAWAKATVADLIHKKTNNSIKGIFTFSFLGYLRLSKG
jgi:hypothetical protein